MSIVSTIFERVRQFFLKIFKKHKEKTMTTIKIKGMSCQHCVDSTRKALEAIKGISNVQIDLAKGEATFDGTVAIETVKEAITKIGFEVTQ